MNGPDGKPLPAKKPKVDELPTDTGLPSDVTSPSGKSKVTNTASAPCTSAGGDDGYMFGGHYPGRRIAWIQAFKSWVVWSWKSTEWADHEHSLFDGLQNDGLVPGMPGYYPHQTGAGTDTAGMADTPDTRLPKEPGNPGAGYTSIPWEGAVAQPAVFVAPLLWLVGEDSASWGDVAEMTLFRDFKTWLVDVDTHEILAKYEWRKVVHYRYDASPKLSQTVTSGEVTQ